MIERRTMAQVATQLVSSLPLRAFLARFRRAQPLMEPTIRLNIFPQRLGAESTQSAMAFLMAAHCADVSPLSLEISAGGGRIAFGLTCRASARSYLESQIAAQYPGAVLDEAADDVSAGSAHYGLCLTLSQSSFLPLLSSDSAKTDPLSGLLAALAVLPANERASVSFTISSLANGWQKTAREYAVAVRDGYPPVEGWTWLVTDPARGLINLLSHTVRSIVAQQKPPTESQSQSAGKSTQNEETAKAIEEKARWPAFRATVRLDVWAAGRAAALNRAVSLANAFRQFSQPHLNHFVPCSPQEQHRSKSRKESILAVPELASLWHLPGKEITVPGIAWATARQAEPPPTLPAGNCVFLARTAFHSDNRRFGMLEHDRFRHLYMVGKAGTGKSTLLKNLIVQDIRQGHGLAVLDPHGDLYDDLLDFIPQNRIKDVVLLDPGDQEYPVSLNPLELPDPTQKAQVASALVDILKRSFENSWGPRLEYILRTCILTLLEVPNSTIMGIPRLLSDDGYRAWALEQVQDPVIRAFWLREYAAMLTNPRLVTEAISPVQNKVGQFLSAPLLRRVLAQPKSTINVQEIMNSGKILLVNLSKGRIGEDSSSLLGAMIISSLHFAAMRRVAVPEAERRPFFVYADEFQSFATSTFASILSEARKYRLGLILAHQYIAQLPEGVKDAVFGNVGTLVSFTVGTDDARYLAREFTPALTAEDLANMERYQMAMRLMVNGTVSPAFTAAGFPPLDGKTGAREKVIDSSRTRYARQAALVDEKIRTWSERVYRARRQTTESPAASGVPREAAPRFSLLEAGEDVADDASTPEAAAAPAPATDQMADSGE